MARFGEVDYRPIERLRQLMTGASQTYLQNKQSQIAMERELQSRAAVNQILADTVQAIRPRRQKSGEYAPVEGLQPGNMEDGGALVEETEVDVPLPARERNRILDEAAVRLFGIPGGQPAAEHLYRYREKEEGLIPNTRWKGLLVKHGGNVSKALEEYNSTSGDPSILKAVADSERKLASSRKIITDFESNPKLFDAYNKIVTNPEFQEAVRVGDTTIAESIISRILGDTTPERVKSRRFLDYVRAINDEEGEIAYLRRLGYPAQPRRKPEVEKKAKPKPLDDLFDEK